VVDIENPPVEGSGKDQTGRARYRFRVDEAISAIDAREVDVYSGRGGADCSYHFQLGETYLVDAGVYKGQLVTGICSDTRPVAYAEPLLSELRARRDGNPYASVYGVLRQTQQPYVLTSSDDYDRPLSNTLVELQAGQRKLQAVTDANGVFKFYDVPAGVYHYKAALPKSLEIAQTILSAPEPQITVPENACFRHDLDAMPTGRIRGRVLGPKGEPVIGDVALFRWDRYNETDMGWWEFQDEQKGYFEFEHVTPGTYVLVFHNGNESDSDIPYPRTFYPGSADFSSAKPLTIGEGQQFLNADIHLAAGTPTRRLIIRTDWTASPTSDHVYVTVQAGKSNAPGNRELSPGVYEVRLFPSETYTIFAWQDCGRRQEGHASLPIGSRETERVVVDGSDRRISEITLALHDANCKPYQQESNR